MNNLLSGKTFLIGFAVGVVAGATAYKYVAVDKKISTKELTDGIMKLAKQVGGASVRSGMGMGRGGRF